MATVGYKLNLTENIAAYIHTKNILESLSSNFKEILEVPRLLMQIKSRKKYKSEHLVPSGTEPATSCLQARGVTTMPSRLAKFDLVCGNI